MPPRTILLTYADGAYREGQARLCDSARAVGFAEVRAASPADLEDGGFAAEHRDILSQPRGSGYWLWKPYLIRQALDRLGPGDVLFYCDSSLDGFYRFDRFPTQLVSLVRRMPQGFAIGPVIHQHGASANWTKRDAFLLLDADLPGIVSRPQLQATWSLWRRTPEALRFADKWLAACCDPRILTDMPNTLGQPNHPGFYDHRHDQSVLTLLAYREKVHFLEFAQTGIFRVLRRYPGAEMSHRFLKAPRNAERLLRGERPELAYAEEALARLTERLRRCATAAADPR
jgi:hypothetical protein